MKTNTKNLKYNNLAYRKHDAREFYQAQNLLKELQDKIRQYELDKTINFKLYDLAYSINGGDTNLFYEFCDVLYNFYFMEDIQGMSDYEHDDLTELVELRQQGRTSNNWIYSKGRMWKFLTYDEILEMSISDIEDNYSNYMSDIIFSLEELIDDLNDVIKYKNIFQFYIDNQVILFKEWTTLREED